ncbi:MAG: heavy-metal-associated domain-containing protein [Candidatus Marinimicrobia bacterium]|nr:heavy-metal-associated domain-containing protein [Candidatus Neomarinimicrobiota bacterium]
MKNYQEDSNMAKTRLKVVGMCCNSCVVGVQKALYKIASVKDVDVDLENEMVTIQDEAGENQEELIKTIMKVKNYKISLIGQSNSISVGL